MEIRTYTNVWNTKKQIYSIWDWKLPQPISLVAVGIFLLVGAVWIPLISLLGISFTSPLGLVLYLSVPIAAAVLGDKPMFEGKSIVQYFSSMITFFKEPKIWTEMRENRTFKNETVEMSSKVWLPVHTELNSGRNRQYKKVVTRVNKEQD